MREPEPAPGSVSACLIVRDEEERLPACLESLAFCDEIGERADRVLDGRVRVDTVLVVQIDDVHPEPPERRVACSPHVFRSAIDAEPASVRRSHVAELCRQNHLLPPSLNRPADKLFVGERPIHVGGIQEIDTELEGTVDRRNRLGFIASGVELGHAHTAKAKR